MKLLRELIECRNTEFLDLFLLSVSVGEEDRLSLIAYILGKLRLYGYEFKAGSSFSDCLIRKGDSNVEVDKYIRLVDRLFMETSNLKELDNYLITAKGTIRT